MNVISIGCPAGIGPEVSVAAAARPRSRPVVLVGDLPTLRAAAEVVGVEQRRLLPFDGKGKDLEALYVLGAGPELSPEDRQPGKPTARSGAAQLAYIEAAYALAKARRGRALVTGPVSKAVIAHSGGRRAARFRGHTEWLQELDGAASSVMCFASSRLVTSLVTTHLPIGKVPRALTPEGVKEATVALATLVRALGVRTPKIAVCSLNPHAGEDQLLGTEETRAIVPGITASAKALGKRARVIGPVGAETAYRKAYAGGFDGVVAMYHDQATIPMKLVAFGEGVNVTMGLSIVRTSVDHGTGYDIAWSGKASCDGMSAALHLAERLLG